MGNVEKCIIISFDFQQDFGPLSPLSKRMKIDDSIAGTENNLNQNGIEITGEVHFESLTNATGI